MSGFVDVLRASYDAVDLPDVASPSVFILLIFGSMREQMIRSKVQVRAIDATSREEQRCPCRWHGGGDSRIHRSGRGCRERMVGASGFTTGLVTFYDASLAAWFLRFADYTSTSDDGGGCAGQRRANKVTQSVVFQHTNECKATQCLGLPQLRLDRTGHGLLPRM